MTPQNKRVMACVVDTECTYISKSPNMVFHFGAVFGDLEQEHSFHTLNMDYYVKEVISDIDNLFFKNKEGTAYGTNPAMKNALKDAELTSDAIDQNVLVGGSTRIPAVQELVKNEISEFCSDFPLPH